MQNVTGTFYILIGGLVIGLLSAVCEFLYKSHSEAKKRKVGAATSCQPKQTGLPASRWCYIFSPTSNFLIGWPGFFLHHFKALVFISSFRFHFYTCCYHRFPNRFTPDFLINPVNPLMYCCPKSSLPCGKELPSSKSSLVRIRIGFVSQIAVDSWYLKDTKQGFLRLLAFTAPRLCWCCSITTTGQMFRMFVHYTCYTYKRYKLALMSTF